MSPAIENIKVGFWLEKINKEVKVRVFDVTGKTVAEVKEKNVNSGKHIFDIDVTSIAIGVYFIPLPVMVEA